LVIKIFLKKNIVFRKVDKLDNTERGAGGFVSIGDRVAVHKI